MYIIPFACNPKSFAIAILVFLFLLFFFLVAVFGQTAKFFTNVSSFLTQGACEQDRTYLIWTH